jgi:hypothetical protein
MLDGAYSCRPVIADLVELAVLVDLPIDRITASGNTSVVTTLQNVCGSWCMG